ncbi:unnamed protein product, partial [Amoebophrya sp. A120]|eukprot:GSA120T00006360001.1
MQQSPFQLPRLAAGGPLGGVGSTLPRLQNNGGPLSARVHGTIFDDDQTDKSHQHSS